MKKYSKLNEIRLSDIEPKGWLHETLKCERDGMPGHLHEIGYPYDTRCWKYKSLADGGYAAWWPYEQTAYRIDSIARMSALLDNLESYDSILGEEMKECLDNEDTFIGPEELKKAESRNRWPHAVLFRAFYALWSKTGNEFYLEKMRQHYLNDNNDYSDSRDVVNVETMLKLYEYFGDERLLNKAKTAFENYNKRPESKETIKDFVADTYIHDHGVTFNEIAKLSTIMYTYTGEKKYLDAAEAAYKRVDDFHMLPDGIHSCSEALCGKETWRTHESCDISDYTWSIGYLLEATGQAEYADKIENAVFNAFFGATAKDFKAIQYLSTVNQVICARNSTHIKAWFDTPRMAYAPHHYPECCVGNIGRAFPNYILRMYQKTENGMALSLYGDSKYEDEEIRIVQSGNYPYRMSIKLDITVKNNEEKVLKLRVPKWSGGTEISVNGQKCDFDVINGYRHFTIPGIDILCDNHEYTTAKQAQSAAHQYGREGVMSELYGVTGWDFDFRRHKAQGDWQAALGVTLRVLSVSWVTMKGDAKRDYPASINYQSDWYKEYSYIEDHFARVSTALTRGKPIVNVAVIHPVETMWLYFGSNEKTSDKRKMLDRQFHTLAEWLLSGTVDFDYICESLLPEQIGEISDSLAVGEMRYKAVIVAGCETLRKTTFDILERFHAAGGKIIFVGEAPKYIDAVCSDKPKRLFDLSLKSAFDKSEILNLLSDERDVSIYEENGERCECLCCQLRGDNGCKWLFIAHLCNEAGTIYESNSDNLALARKRIIVIKGKYKPIIYDTLTGDIKQTDFEISGEKTFIGHTFYQNDSLLLKLCDPETAEKGTDEKKRQLISKEYITGKVDFSLTEPNALLLDIAEFALDGEPHREREEIRKIQYIIKSELNIENGRAQAWATDEEENGHTVTLKYKFFSELDFSGANLALEDAELSTVIFNGEKISIAPNGYFTDRQIKTIALPLIKKGENTLSVTLPVTRLTCLEACFVLGNFRVRLDGTEKTILPMREKIGFGDITAQGMPFYGARIEYFADIEAPRDCCASVSVRCYRGMLLRAELDGEQLGIIAFSPYEVYAPNVKKGKHRLKLTLYGSRYNCFGPLHVTDDKLLWQGPDAWKFMHDGKDRWKYEYSLKPLGIIAGPEIKYYI